LKPTDIAHPDYFHKVVDCQWACPAHTNVPEYIRLIAQGRYADALDPSSSATRRVYSPPSEAFNVNQDRGVGDE
jgi:hypothetical protein